MERQADRGPTEIDRTPALFRLDVLYVDGATDMPIPVPTLVRIEYWNPERGDWGVGHASWNLLDPATYVRKATTRGTIVRAVEIDTGKIHYGLDGGDLL